MKTSQVGVKLIKSLEGLQLTSYICPAGVWTVGYGHTGPDVQPGMRYTEQQAESVLCKDLEQFEAIVEGLVKIQLTQNQFDALVSFVYNVGGAAFKSSTLLRRLNNKENPINVAKEELPRWNKGEGGKVLEGLNRRRSCEVELFCQASPIIKEDLIAITSKQRTWLKKQPISSDNLSNDQKAKVNQSRTIKDCRILDKKDNHTYLELGFGLGKWWIFDDHWKGLIAETIIQPYATQEDLRYLRNFPYFYQQDNGPQGWRQCQTSSIAMCLRYLDVPGINDDTDYLKIVNKYGDTTEREPHFHALAELGVYAKFTLSADEQDVKDEIDAGLPVAAGIYHHGPVSNPSGGGHFIVITGYSKDYWLVQDPYGELDLVNGGWAATGAVAGKNIHYSFKNLNPRLFYGGGANGWCWLNFRKK